MGGLNLKGVFDSVLNEVGRANTGRLLGWLETHRFYVVPASRKHHNNVACGLLKHSLEVCNEALHLRAERIERNAELAKDLPKESVVVAALLHDVCKWNVFYIDKDSHNVRFHSKASSEGHGLKSVNIIDMLGYPLTDEERLAIWWHMGKGNEPSYKGHEDEYARSCQIELCTLIRQADYNATHLQERFEKEIGSLKTYDTARLLRYLKKEKSNFYTHASGSHHSYSTGVVAHSLGVYRHMMKICDGLDRNEAAAVALLHDIAMQNQSDTYGGHGRRSRDILEKRLVFGLSDEALQVILYHKMHKNPSTEELKVRNILLWKKLHECDTFDADHDITDLLKHYRDEVF